MSLRRFENKARQSWWLVHIEAWRQSGLGRAKYCRQHGLTSDNVRSLAELPGRQGSGSQACGISGGTASSAAPRGSRKAPEEARPLSFRREHGYAQSRRPGVLGDARRGDELERDERAGVRRRACICRRPLCANGAIGWTTARWISTGERIFIPQPVRSLALVLTGRRRKRA